MSGALRQPSILQDNRVAVIQERARYSRTAPFPPSESFPEWLGGPVGEEDNPAYRAVRAALAALDLDASNTGTQAWNPLEALVTPGDRVILKPNLVSHVNLGAGPYGETDTDSLVTHGSVIRAVLDYTAKALRGRGQIIIGDCPIQDTDWDAVVRLVALDQIVADARLRFPGIEFVIRDYRLGKAIIRGGVMVRRVAEKIDPRADVEVDLGAHSLLMPLMEGGAEFGVSRYPRHRMRRAHRGETNLYLIARDFLECDVLINLPKMKAHMKAGMTGALKNLVGINSHKDYLPHFRYGSPRHGGDEYPDGNWFWDLMWRVRHRDWDRDSGVLKMFYFAIGAALKQLLPVLAHVPKQSVAMGGGGWYGNDTLWRTVLDINRVFFYFDRFKHAVSERFSERKYLAILDGLIGGHRESPLAPSPVPSGVMLAARNPAALDAVATALMGFDINRIPQVSQAFRRMSLQLVDYTCESVRIIGHPELRTIEDVYSRWNGPRFEASRGFRGRVELHQLSALPPSSVVEGADDVAFAE